ncbi:hypothetical protein [Niabella aquatica]
MQINMTTIAVYLFFVGALSGYRASKYWPKELTALSWLRKGWLTWACVLLGTVLLGIDRGWTTGLLLALCIYMALLSCVVFFTNCNRGIRSGALILFHMLCMLGVIFKF